jgi:tetratricopeptide (TPR) repeat protein
MSAIVCAIVRAASGFPARRQFSIALWRSAGREIQRVRGWNLRYINNVRLQYMNYNYWKVSKWVGKVQVNMTNSPQRFLISSFMICILLGLGIDFLSGTLSNYYTFLPSDRSFTSGDSLSMARYYWRIGQFEKAIEEYQSIIPTLADQDRHSASRELERLLLLDKSAPGRVVGQIAYYSWSLPPKLYALAGLSGILFIVLLWYRYRKETPIFIIQSFSDRTGLNIGSDLPKIAIERIHELAWRAQNLGETSNLIAENIELPTLNLMSEGDNERATELIELALLFSVGSTNLPFSRLINTFKLWIEQPQFLVRGVIDKQGEIIILKMSLFDQKTKNTEKFWHIDLPYQGEIPASKIVDAIIYPLLYRFNKISAGRWEALQALHLGLEEFQLFKENQSVPSHLESARRHLEEAIMFDPVYDLARYNLSLFLLATGEFERAREYLRDLSSSSKEPQLKLWAKYNYGIALFHLSQDWAYELAAKNFQELLKQDESKPLEHLIRSALSMTYAKMARRRSKERESLVNDAVAQADKVIAEIELLTKNRKKSETNAQMLQEALANAVASKGFACMASENYQQSIKYFQESVQLSPRNISNKLGLAEVYSLNNLKDEAVDTLKTTSIQAPLSGYTNYRLGNLYRELGKYDEAIEVLKRAPRYAYARLVLGKIYLEQEEFESALEEFRQAVQLNSHLSEAWVNIAWTILQMEDPTLMKEALSAARRSLQLEKNKNQIWHRHAIIALCLHQSKKKELALSAAQKAVEHGPKQAQAYYYLALTQAELEQIEHAQKSVEKVRELDKKGNWMLQAAQLLKQLK